MNISELMQEKKKETDRLLIKYLPHSSDYAQSIYDAVSYSITVGGKRIRPVLLMEFYNAFMRKKADGISLSKESEDRLKDVSEGLACALEMIHTYSLVHDDLPAMDNDLLRRGNPTTHAKYGHAMGILAGDALLNLAASIAFEKTAMYAADTYVCAKTAKASEIIFRNSGIDGMIKGQVIDVDGVTADAGTDKLFAMYELKTSCLLRAGICAGGILGGADDKETELLSEISKLLGIAFQIKDDILDVTSSVEELGKPIGSDADNNKVTSVTMLSLEEAEKLVKEYTDKAIELYDSLGLENDFLRELMLSLVNRTY